MGKRKNHTGLTPAEEAFCVAYARTGNARIAYEKCTPPRRPSLRASASMDTNCCNGLTSHYGLRSCARLSPKTAGRRSSLCSRNSTKPASSRMETEQPGVACVASMDKARLAGFLKPVDKVHLGGVSVNVMLTAADVSVC